MTRQTEKPSLAAQRHASSRHQGRAWSGCVFLSLLRSTACLLAALLLCLPERGAALQTGAELYSSTFTTFRNASERERFWTQMRGHNITEYVDDSSLPELQLPVRRVALCITGGARGFPLQSLGLYESIRSNLVDALQANLTDIYYLLELNDVSDSARKGGTFNYSYRDLEPAFAMLPPKFCTDGCYNQFLKLDQCMDHILQAEMVEGWKYDFVVRQRPDYAVQSPFPSVWTMKRAAYASRIGAMKSDDSFHTHRDFAEALLGMTRLIPFAAPQPNSPPCAMLGDLVMFMRAERVCGKSGVMCECWVRLSLLAHNATVVTGPRKYSVGVRRLPSSEPPIG